MVPDNALSFKKGTGHTKGSHGLEIYGRCSKMKKGEASRTVRKETNYEKQV